MSSYTANSVSSFPKGKHYAIITFGTIHIPGDERSRTHPGHGYPESYETTTSYRIYLDFSEFEKEVDRLTRKNESFVPLIVEVPEVSTTVKVKVGI